MNSCFGLNYILRIEINLSMNALNSSNVSDRLAIIASSNIRLYQ